MNKDYIEVKIPILNSVEEMKVVKTFNEEQLWYVCAIAKAFEKSEKENANLEQKLKQKDVIIEKTIEILKLCNSQCAKETIQILKGDNNE